MLREARVIKSGTATMEPLGGQHVRARCMQVLRRERLEALEQAQAIVAEAKAKAEQLRVEAEQQVGALRAEAERQGYETGLAGALADTLRVAIQQEQLDRLGLERSVQMARLIAERIVGRHLDSDPSAVAEMAQAALAEVRGARQVRFVVHPGDVPTVTAALPPDVTSPMLVEVVAGEHLARGDFELRTDAGRLDASLGTRLAALMQAITENLS